MRFCSSRNPKDFAVRENGTLPAARYYPMKSLRLALLEIFEETGLIVENTEQIGLLHFYKNSQRENPDWIVHAFLACQSIGVPIDGREGRLKRFKIDALPFDEMWQDDQYWCRLALEGTRLEGWFYFSGDFENLIDHRIEVKPPPNQIEV